MTKYDYLMHHGVKGMKWGVRRYQNYDGTRIKSNGTQNRTELAKRYMDYDTDAGHREEEIYKKIDAEKAKLKRPKTFFDSDGRLSKEGREYMDKVDKIDKKYDKQLKKNWAEQDKEREEQSKAIFLNSDIEPDIKAAKDTRNKLDALWDDRMSIDSPAYQKAFEEYKKTHKDSDDVEYGFDHYEWREGHKAFDAAYKEYHKEAKELEKQYKDQTTNIGKKVLEDSFDEYADTTMFMVDQFVRYRYDELKGR